MGNLFECMGKNQPPDISIEGEQMSFISTQSITNYSLPSKVDTTSDTVPPPSITTNSSYKFSWYRLRSVYLDPVQNKSSFHKIKIQPAVLEVMQKIFTDIKNNIGPMSRTFYDCLIEMDKTFPTQFEECAVRNLKSVTEGKVLVERIKSHIVCMIHVHTIIINHLKNEEEKKVEDIIKLIAISHMLLKVKPILFNLMDMVTTKFLLRAGILCDENAEAVVIYFNFVTTSILYNMKTPAADNTNIGYSYIARENYRQMKEWYHFVDDLHKKTNELKSLDSPFKIAAPDVDPTPSHSTIPTEILKQDTCFFKHFSKKKRNKNSVDN